MQDNIPLELLADIQDACSANGYIITSLNSIPNGRKQPVTLQLTMKQAKTDNGKAAAHSHRNGGNSPSKGTDSHNDGTKGQESHKNGNDGQGSHKDGVHDGKPEQHNQADTSCRKRETNEI